MINSHLLSADDQLVKSQLFLTGSYPVRLLLPNLPLSYWAERAMRVLIPLLGVGSSNLSTSQKTVYSQSNWSTRPRYLPRDFKSLVSTSESRLVRANAGIHDHRSHSPGLYTGFSSRQQGYQQKAVKNSNNPRINGTVLGQLFTHKRNRFESKARINGTAFTHKRNRQCGSRLCGNWSTATPPVSTSITNNPIVKSKTYIGYAKIRINSYE